MTQAVLLSPCGWGNLGDAAIQEAAIAGVRRHLGDDVRIVALTQNPTDTAARHGVTAYRIAGFEVENYSLGPNPAHEAEPATSTHAKAEGAVGAEIVADKAPVTPRRPGFARRMLRSLIQPPRAVLAELRHWMFAFRLMKASRILIISGGGQLDEFWGGPWGHPYAMFKWSTAARFTGCRVVFLSVGAGTLKNSMTRRLIRSALHKAFYKSFRDPRTVATIESLQVNGDLNLLPDLAFSHPAARAPAPAQVPGSRRLIALSPIVYKDPLRWPERDGAFFNAYLDELASFGLAMLARGDAVLITTSDYADNSAAEELHARIRTRAAADAALEIDLPADTAALLAQLKRSDILVASRLHGVILAQISATPVVAVSYNWKVDEQMKRTKCAEFCVSIENFDTARLTALVDRVLADRTSLSQRLANETAESFDSLEAQYAQAFRDLGRTARSGGSVRPPQ